MTAELRAGRTVASVLPEDVTARDPLPTDQGDDPSRGHGVWMNEYSYAGGDGVATIVRFRGTRLGEVLRAFLDVWG